MKSYNKICYKDVEKIEKQICISISKKYELEAKYSNLKAKVPDYTSEKK